MTEHFRVGDAVSTNTKYRGYNRIIGGLITGLHGTTATVSYKVAGTYVWYPCVQDIDVYYLEHSSGVL